MSKFTRREKGQPVLIDPARRMAWCKTCKIEYFKSEGHQCP